MAERSLDNWPVIISAHGTPWGYPFAIATKQEAPTTSILMIKQTEGNVNSAATGDIGCTLFFLCCCPPCETARLHVRACSRSDLVSCCTLEVYKNKSVREILLL